MIAWILVHGLYVGGGFVAGAICAATYSSVAGAAKKLRDLAVKEGRAVGGKL